MLRPLVCVIALMSACVSLASAAPGVRCYTIYTIQRGDTAIRIALRLTNDARSVDAPWFQIFDPSRGALVPKRRYAHIEPGWQACVVEPLPGAVPSMSQIAVAAPAHAARPSIPRWWWVPILFFAATLAWIAAQNFLDGRHATSRTLERFGMAFIREFERPLLQDPSVESPVRSRLRISPQRGEVEILLAPNDGWHYPNLSDHRRNVEYDVERIVRLLGERRVACGQLGMRGTWVVIPFRLEGSIKKEERA
jgi:hypothetical protein